jgi:hypothetical protein
VYAHGLGRAKVAAQQETAFEGRDQVTCEVLWIHVPCAGGPASGPQEPGELLAPGTDRSLDGRRRRVVQQIELSEDGDAEADGVGRDQLGRPPFAVNKEGKRLLARVLDVLHRLDALADRSADKEQTDQSSTTEVSSAQLGDRRRLR